MTFALSGDEARFLRDKIITSPQSKDSLLAHILSHCARAACDCVSFNALATLEMPERLQREFELARDFAHLISGAHLRYNIAFFSSINQPEKAERIRQEWDRWVLEMDVFDFSRWDTWAMLRHLRIDANRHAVLFVVKWIETYARQRHSVPDDEFDAFVTKREIQIKGRERAKIGNWFEYDGDWIGIDYLQYRWPNARKIIMDIATGLDENDAATHA
jgi:hypothetical protein